jgi:hypothetical protein
LLLSRELLKKDERIESVHAQTIDLERKSKAAMLYSYTIIAELEASRTAEGARTALTQLVY